MQLVTTAQSRRLDELTIQQGTPGHTLMERAGSGATEILLAPFPFVKRRRVVVVAGKGNNGGDGFVIARLLRRAFVRAEVVLLGDPEEVKGDALLALQAMRRARVPLLATREMAAVRDAFDGAALIVDALFGTGLNAPISGFYADVVSAMNDSGLPIFSVDIPSGLDADRGVPLGVSVRAAATATFGFAKLGQILYPGAGHVGNLSVVDIGITADAMQQVPPSAWYLEASDVAPFVPRRAADAHKGDAGHVLLIAGSRGHSGAALIAANAACRTGAGLTTLAGPASLNGVFAGGTPEVMTAALPDHDGRITHQPKALRALFQQKRALVVGPGLGTHSDAEQTVRFCIAESNLPIVLDADALTCLSRDLSPLDRHKGGLILTPHPGEMARLIGSDVATVQADRIGCARDFAVRHGCVLVLKGARTVIAAPAGEVWINSTGNSGMASGGMGDALSGILGALLAQGLGLSEAARLGVFVHGAAADVLAQRIGPIGYLASDLALEVPHRLAALLEASTDTGVSDPTVRGRRK